MSYAVSFIPVKINTNVLLSNALNSIAHRLLRWLVAGYSLRRLGFDSIPVRVRFMADVVTLWLTELHRNRGFCEYFGFTTTVLLHHCSVLHTDAVES
jgi:hypothetical protein